MTVERLRVWHFHRHAAAQFFQLSSGILTIRHHVYDQWSVDEVLSFARESGGAAGAVRAP
jgi:hypothetical protein